MQNTLEISRWYERAQQLQQGISTKPIVFNTTLYPHWIDNSDSFWYVRDLRDGGSEYRIVDATAGTNKAAFNHEELANILFRESGQEVKAYKLPIQDINVYLSPLRVIFCAFGKKWLFDNDKLTCEIIGEYSDSCKVSPDGKRAVFVRDCNLWVSDLEKKEERALTTDGEQYYVYAGISSFYGQQTSSGLEVIWSPDSARLFTVVLDTRKVKLAPPLVQHVPSEDGLKPKLLNHNRKLALPGDEYIDTYHFIAIDIATGKICKADYSPSPVVYPATGFFTSFRGWWALDSKYAYFVDLERGGKIARLIELNSYTGATRVLIEESTDFCFTFIPVSHGCTLLMPLFETNELIWYSDRSGWAHFYLYDLTTGTLKNPITKGNWQVRNALHFDVKRRDLIIQTAGRVPIRNPYYCDICRVNIDTGELTPILFGKTPVI